MLLVTFEVVVQGARYTYAHVMQNADFRVTDRHWVSAAALQEMYDGSTLSNYVEFAQFVQKIDPTLPGVYHMVGVRVHVQHFELAALALQ